MSPAAILKDKELSLSGRDLFSEITQATSNISLTPALRAYIGVICDAEPVDQIPNELKLAALEEVGAIIRQLGTRHPLVDKWCSLSDVNRDSFSYVIQDLVEDEGADGAKKLTVNVQLAMEEIGYVPSTKGSKFETLLTPLLEKPSPLNHFVCTAVLSSRISAEQRRENIGYLLDRIESYENPKPSYEDTIKNEILQALIAHNVSLEVMWPAWRIKLLHVEHLAKSEDRQVSETAKLFLNMYPYQPKEQFNPIPKQTTQISPWSPDMVKEDLAEMLRLDGEKKRAFPRPLNVSDWFSGRHNIPDEVFLKTIEFLANTYGRKIINLPFDEREDIPSMVQAALGTDCSGVEALNFRCWNFVEASKQLETTMSRVKDVIFSSGFRGKIRIYNINADICGVIANTLGRLEGMKEVSVSQQGHPYRPQPGTEELKILGACKLVRSAEEVVWLIPTPPDEDTIVGSQIKHLYLKEQDLTSCWSRQAYNSLSQTLRTLVMRDCKGVNEIIRAVRGTLESVTVRGTFDLNVPIALPRVTFADVDYSEGSAHILSGLSEHSLKVLGICGHTAQEKDLGLEAVSAAVLMTVPALKLGETTDNGTILGGEKSVKTMNTLAWMLREGNLTWLEHWCLSSDEVEQILGDRPLGCCILSYDPSIAKFPYKEFTPEQREAFEERWDSKLDVAGYAFRNI